MWNESHDIVIINQFYRAIPHSLNYFVGARYWNGAKTFENTNNFHQIFRVNLSDACEIYSNVASFFYFK